MTDFLSQILLIISNALLIPVMLLLIGFTALIAVYLGGLIREAWERQRHIGEFRRFVNDLKHQPLRTVKRADIPARFGLPAQIMSRLSEKNIDKDLDDAHLAMEAALSKLSIGIRVGPMLGLMGTLIPLGPALIAMSGGNIAALTQNLVVAFTTTVVGLLIAGISFVIYMIRQRWYAQDLNDLEFIIKRLE
jgi:biopolymer transport protein ExbB/TolQ